jgi:hypothetical protein
VVPAALRELRAHQLEHARSLRQKILRRIHDEAPRMRLPDTKNPQVYFGRFNSRFGSQRVLSVVSVLEGRRSKVNQRVVPTQFVRQRRVHGRKKIIGARPVRRSVNGSTVAEDDGSVMAGGGFFKLPLDMKNGALRGSSGCYVGAPRKAAPEDDAGGFRKNLDMLAKGRVPDEFERCRLAGAGAAGEDDTARNMRIRTVAKGSWLSAVQMDTETVPTWAFLKSPGSERLRRRSRGRWGIVRRRSASYTTRDPRVSAGFGSDIQLASP